MINLDDVTKENIKKNIIQIGSYRILIVGGSGFGKTNSLLNLINHNQILMEFIYMLKVYTKQNRNF